MTATAPSPEPAAPAAADVCPRCGAALRPEQDWCLECGAAARTRVVGGANWKLPVAIVAGVVLLAGAAFAYAFFSVSDGAGRSARKLERTPRAATPPTPAVPPAATPTVAAPDATPTTPPATTATPGAPAPAPAPATPAKAVGRWPAGRTAYTVILLSASRAGAAAKAKRLAREGEDVGLLDSSDFPSLEPGYTVVFSGRYDEVGAAQQAARRLGAAGSPGAYAKLVSPR